MKQFNLFSWLDVRTTLALTVGSPSAHRRGTMLKLISVLVLIFTFGIGQMWGTDITFNLTNQTQITTKTQNKVEFTSGSAKVTITKSSNGTRCDNYMPGGNTDASHTRTYGTNPIEFNAGSGNRISSIQITATSSSGSVTSLTGGTWSATTTVSNGSSANIKIVTLQTAAQSISVTPSGTSRIEQIVFTLASNDSPALNSITISGSPTTNTYEAGDVFDPTGLIATGTYSNSTSSAIESGITWTAYNGNSYVSLANATLTQGQTTLKVKATVGTVTSAEFTVTGLSVVAAYPKVTITQSQVTSFTNKYAEYSWSANSVSGKLNAYKNSGMQFNTSNNTTSTGYVYNNVAVPGKIVYITMTTASGTERSWTPYVSSSALTPSNYSTAGTALTSQTVKTTGTRWNVTGDNSYFYLLPPSSASVISSIVIAYESCTELAQINGSVSWSNGEATVSWDDVTGMSSSSWKLYYSAHNANSWTEVTGLSASAGRRSNTTPISVLTAGQEYDFKVTGTYSGSNYCAQDYTFTFSSVSPKITLGSISGNSVYVYGVAGGGSAQTFSVTGVGLTGETLTVTAPDNFQVSTDNGTSWGTSKTIAISNNAVNATVKVRLVEGLAVNSYNDNVTVSGGSADEKTVAVSGTVSPACEAPTINTQPAATASYNLNESATLTVVATKNGTGPALTYQWYSNTANSKTTPTPTAIDNATSSSYAPSTEETGTKYYFCEVSSGACSVTSNISAVTVNTPSLTVSKTAIAFGDKAIGSGSYEETFTVSGTNLASGAGITIARQSGGSTMYTVDKPTITQTSAGTVTTTTVTVTYTPTTKNAHNATLTISSTGAEDKTISLSGAGRWQATFLDGEGNVHATKLAADNHAPDKPADPTSCDANSTTFMGWTQSAWNGKKAQSYVDGLTEPDEVIYTGVLPNMTDHMIYYPVFAQQSGSAPTITTDELEYADFGFAACDPNASNGSTSYPTAESLTEVTGTSSATYLGFIAKHGNGTACHDYIQLRSNNNNSGIITTGSGGKAKKVTVAWDDAMTQERIVQVYGKNTAYAAASELYDTETDGDLLGTITWASSNPQTELTITGDYDFIGLRSSSNALFLSSVSIDWASGGGYTYSNYMTTCCQDLAQVSGTVACTSGTTATLSWSAVTGAESYKVKVPGSSSHNDWTAATSPVSVTGLTAGENYTAYFQAFDENGSNCPEGPESTTAFTTPKITVTGTPSPMAYVYNAGPSTAQSFAVSAVGMAGVVTITAPTNFEVSKTSSTTGFDNSVSITPSLGTISSTTIYVRLKSGLDEGNYGASNIVVSGNYAASVNVSVSGSVSPACENPTIGTHPVSASYNMNVTATALSVEATKNGSGPALTYQWYSNTSNDNTTGTIINGATNSSYTPATSAAGTKYYYCVVSSGACATPSNCAAITVNTPSVVVSENSIAFGAKKIGSSYTETFTVSGSNLAYNAGIGLAISAGKFSIDETSVAQTSTGAISSTTITVTYTPDEVGAHAATITISCTGVADQTVTLSGTGRYEDTYKTGLHSGVTAWADYAEGVVMPGSGYTVPNPGDIAVGDREGDNCQGLHFHFAGWVTDANKEAGTISENIIPASGTKDADNTTYWAVWEKETTAGVDVTDVINSSSFDFSGTSAGSWTDKTVTGTSGAEYAIRAMAPDGSEAFRWNSNGYLVSTKAPTSGAKLKSVTVTTTDVNKNIGIYGNNTAYSVAAPSTTSLSTLSATTSGGTYNFTSEYSYIGLKGTASSTYIASISIRYVKEPVYADPKVECIACTATANAGTAAVDETGAFTTSNIAVKATDVSAGANCSLRDYGFVWSSSVTEPTLVEATGDAATNCVKVQVGTNDEVTSFTGTLTGTFSADNPIYVRSYAKNENASGTYQYSDVLTITSRQVSFNMHEHGGDAPASQFLNNGAKATAVIDPSEAGWIFNGWWDNDTYTGDAWDFANNTVSGASLVLHAKWTAKPKYTITLNPGNGSVSAAGWTQDGDVWKQEQEHGDAAITFPSANAGCAGWVFQGWKLGEAVNDASSFTADKNTDDELVPTNNVTYYAVYRENATGGTTYNKITSASELTTGDYVIGGAYGSNYYAMKNEVDGTHMAEKSFTAGTSVTKANLDNSDAYIWTFIKFNDKVIIKSVGSGKYFAIVNNAFAMQDEPQFFTYSMSEAAVTLISPDSKQLTYSTNYTVGTSQTKAIYLYKQGAGMTGNYFTNPSCDDLTITGVADPAAGGTVLLSAASAKAGDKVYAYYEVDDAYKFDNWSIAGTGSVLSSTSAQLTEITVGSANTTITANFTAKAVATVVFMNNDVVVDSRSWVEGQVPTAPALINGISGDACDETSDMHYGWTQATWVSTKEDLSAYTVYENGDNLPAIAAGDDGATITYHAIWAKGEVDELNPVIQTLQYDTWTYAGSTTDKSAQNYRLFHTGSYIESAAFDRSKLSKVIVYGGSFGGEAYNSLTIGDGTNIWKNVTVSGASQTGVNTYTNGTALSGTGTIRVISNSGTADAEKGVRISKVEIYVANYTYSKYRTACCTPLAITADVDEEVGKHIEADKTAACAGEVITISKTQEGFYNFSDWNIYKTGDESTTVDMINANQFEMPAYPVTVSAIWNPKNYVATVNEPDASLGSIVAVSGGSVDQGIRYVAYGSTLTVEAAAADEDHYFSNWTITTTSGSTSSSSNPLNLTMPGSNVTITANFGEVQYPTLTVGTSDDYTLTAKLANGDDIDDPDNIRSGTAIKVTFEPNGQYEVTEWSLNNGTFTEFDVDGNVISFNMPDVDVNVNVTARAYYELSLLTPENGSIDEVVIAGESQSVANMYRVYAGNAISVTAVPTSSSYKFNEWQLDGTAASFNGTTATATLTVGSENLSLKAVFAAKEQYTLTLKALGRTHATINALEGASMYELISNAVAAPSISDQEFLGWSQEADNATKIISTSADLPLNGNTELYAVYQEKAHYYRKVTSSAALTDGQYLIVYETGEVAFNGGLETLSGTSNTIEVSINEGTIAVTNTTTAAEFTIAAKEGGFSILSASGKYIGRTANDNGLDASETDDYTNTISFTDSDDADIVCSSAHMRFNSASNELRFRYYKSGTYTGQNAIQLYKRDAPGANKSIPTLTVATDVNADDIFTDGVAGNVIVEAGGTFAIGNTLEVQDMTIQSTSGASGQVTGSNATISGDLYLEIKLLGDGTGTMTTEESQQWYCISAPFDVNMNGGFFWGDGTPMRHNVDFQAFVFDGGKRASSGTSGWQRVSGKMEAGKAYLIGFDDELSNQKTIRLKAMSNTIPTADALPTTGHDADDANKNWNGVGNPTLHYIALDGFDAKVQCYDNNIHGYNPYSPETHNYVVGTALFMQAENAISLANATNEKFRAPKRVNEENEKYSFCVEIAKDADSRCDNRLYVSTSEEATSTYEPGKDMTTMNGTTAKFAALIWTNNYGLRLAAEDVPMVNHQADYELGVYAPKNGTYVIRATEASEDATLYLTKDGAIIWDLTMSPYEAELTKGSNAGYGLKIVAAPKVTTDVEQPISDSSLKGRATKVIIDEHVFILRGEQLFDVTGKAVK